jgi:hypothetical protein
MLFLATPNTHTMATIDKKLYLPPLQSCATHAFFMKDLSPLFPLHFKLDGGIGINLCCRTQPLTIGAFGGGSHPTSGLSG